MESCVGCRAVYLFRVLVVVCWDCQPFGMWFLNFGWKWEQMGPYVVRFIIFQSIS